MKASRILVVDDEPLIRQSLRGVLEDEGYQTKEVESGEACLDELRRSAYDLLLLDIWLPGIDGLETLARVQEMPSSDRPAVVVISGDGSVETAVRATKLGAFDFVEKPLTIDKVTVVVKNALQQRKLEREVRELKDDDGRLPRIIGESVPMRALRQQLALMAATDGRVLIFGESGTGKELVAHAIHAMSPRALGDLCRRQLRGHSGGADRKRDVRPPQGSFTGASEDKVGKLQKADGGTVFLDEVGDMSLKTQAKLLRVLDRQSFEPVGLPRPSMWISASSRRPTRTSMSKWSGAIFAKICTTV